MIDVETPGWNRDVDNKGQWKSIGLEVYIEEHLASMGTDKR